MEVLVTFLAGDPDRPVIIGTLYNATHATPDPLPQRSTRSGIRTQTSPGGGGFNEISFEDAKGVERIHMHAQKDLEQLVNDTHIVNVKVDQKNTITRNQESAIGGNQFIGVGQSRSVLVNNNLSEQVKGNHTSTVTGNRTAVVRGDAMEAIDGVAARNVKTDEVTVIGGDKNLTVLGTSITHVGGKGADEKGLSITFVEGSAFTTVTDKLLLKAEKASDGGTTSIRLECGDSFIEIHEDKITLSAKTIEVTGGDALKLKGKDAQVGLDQDGAKIQGDPVNVKSPKGSSMSLDGQSATVSAPGNTTVKGSQVSLKSSGGGPASDQDQSPNSSNSPNLNLVFWHGRPVDDSQEMHMAGAHYRAVVEDLVYEGDTGGDGRVSIWVPPTAKVVHVVVWANEKFPSAYKHGPLVWLVHLVDDMGASSSSKGARARLRNLAYEPGALAAPDGDDLTKLALLDFQLDQGLTATGALDADTQNKLDATYGSAQ
jgi:type VI secretion system secreted protein VgrG